MTPAKGEYLVFSGPSEATLRTPVVPVPSKQTAGVYTFRRSPVIQALYTYISSIWAFILYCEVGKLVRKIFPSMLKLRNPTI